MGQDAWLNIFRHSKSVIITIKTTEKLRSRGHFDNVSLSPSTGIFVNRIYTEIICRVEPNVWLNELRFNVPFNSISFISGQRKGEHEKLCAMKRRLGSEIISPPAGLEPDTPWSEVGSADRSATRSLL